jgi:predicted alpha/beta superfamily hydrolase
MRSVAFFSAAALAALTLAFTPADAQTVVTRYEVLPIHSTVYGQTLRVFVYTAKAAPAEPAPLPVVYLPEVDASDSACFQQLEQLMQAGTLPYMRIVGIERNPAGAPALAAGPIAFNSPRGIGDPATAANEWYYRCIAAEVIPAVEAKYRCSAFRVLCLDEATGFGTYMLRHQSRGFSAYLSVAPFFWLNEGRRPLAARSFQAYYAGWRDNEALLAADDDSNPDEAYLKTGRRSWIKQ